MPVGASDGEEVGNSDGVWVGLLEGSCDGERLGLTDGLSLVLSVGLGVSRSRSPLRSGSVRVTAPVLVNVVMKVG